MICYPWIHWRFECFNYPEYCGPFFSLRQVPELEVLGTGVKRRHLFTAFVPLPRLSQLQKMLSCRRWPLYPWIYLDIPWNLGCSISGAMWRSYFSWLAVELVFFMRLKSDLLSLELTCIMQTSSGLYAFTPAAYPISAHVHLWVQLSHPRYFIFCLPIFSRRTLVYIRFGLGGQYISVVTTSVLNSQFSHLYKVRRCWFFWLMDAC